MTMTVTMLTTVMGEAGSLLVAGNDYTVSDKFGAELVGLKRASDTYKVLSPSSFGIPQVLLQTGIPFVLAGGASISMGNNGALTGITTLRIQYPRCYLYLPTGAIYAASPAGWYYSTINADKTSAKVYNNLYVSGTPLAPAVPTPFVTTGPGAFVQTNNTPIAAYAVVVKGGSIGPNGCLRVTTMGQVVDTPASKYVETYLAGQNISSNTPSGDLYFVNQARMQNNGSGNQLGNYVLNFGSSYTAAFSRFNVDTTQDQLLTLTLRLGQNSGVGMNDWAAFESATVEAIYGA